MVAGKDMGRYARLVVHTGWVALTIVVAAQLATALLPRTALAADVVSGVMLDDRGRALRGAPVFVRDPNGILLVESMVGDNGAYCIGHEEIDSGGEYEVCVTTVAGKTGCSEGAPNTVAGTMLGADRDAISRAEVTIYDDQWVPVVSDESDGNETDGDGAYCITSEAIKPGTFYRACVTPASIGSIPGGISGTMFGAESEPLRQANLTVFDPNGEVLVSERTSYDGRYCLTHDDMKPGVRHRVCASMVAGAASCSPTESTVSGAMLVGGYPVANTALTVESEDGTLVATGSTNEEGAYCIYDAAIQPGEIHNVCAELPAHCACCCNCCCAAVAPVLLLPPTEPLLVAGAIGVGALTVGVIGWGIDGQEDISRFR